MCRHLTAAVAVENKYLIPVFLYKYQMRKSDTSTRYQKPEPNARTRYQNQIPVPKTNSKFQFHDLLISTVVSWINSVFNLQQQRQKYLVEPRAAAAVGQSGLMSLYEAMFAQYGVKIAQVTWSTSVNQSNQFEPIPICCYIPKVLVTKPDFYNDDTRRHLASTISELISLNIVPIINTNDAVSPPPMADEDLAGASI